MKYKMGLSICVIAIYAMLASVAFAADKQVPRAVVTDFNGTDYEKALNIQSKIIKDQTTLILTLRSRINSLEERVRALEAERGVNYE